MIDTDKYEGHTAGPWKIEGAKTIIGAEDLRITVKGGTQRDKNLRLVADAPLLLAEVERLREVIEQHGIDISFDPKHNEEDEAILYEWLDATSQGYWGSVYEYKVMKQEESE